MEGFQADSFSLNSLFVLSIAAGVVLVLWSLVGRPIKAGPVHLPLIVNKVKRGIVILIALIFVFTGSYGLWTSFAPEKTLKVFVGVGGEEFSVITEIIDQFEKDNSVTVNLENVTWEMALDRLEEERVDLVTFDVNARYELVFRGLVEELSEEEHKGLIPSSVNPVLLEYLEAYGKRYFAPFRSNVQLVLLNKEKFAEIGTDYPETWWDVKEVAQRFYERDGEARVVIQATDDVIPLTLLQIIRAAGGTPYKLLDPQTKAALEFVQQLNQYVFPKSSQVNWETANGYLLSESVYMARNWAFSLSVIREAGREADFESYSGWSWSNNSRPSNLLGGEFLALPKNARYKEEAIELMRFLMSKEVQIKLMTELGWPAMRLDVMGETDPWLQSYQRTINAALSYAEPTPDYWHPEMPDIYRRMFHEIASLDPDANIESTLERYQLEIDAMIASRRR
jgi:ABC-type glycerol-3-phosphate transport system substrate-binding protein